MSMCFTPRCETASTTALWIAGVEPIVPDSPMPFAPSGLRGLSVWVLLTSKLGSSAADGIVDGGHFFDLLAENVVFDYIITIPGYPRHVEGRKAVAELYRPYGT